MKKYLDNAEEFEKIDMPEDFRQLFKDVTAMDYMVILSANPNEKTIFAINVDKHETNFIYLINGKTYRKKKLNDIEVPRIGQAFTEVLQELAIESLNMIIEKIYHEAGGKTERLIRRSKRLNDTPDKPQDEQES